MISQRVHLIKRHSNPLSYTECMPHGGVKHYVIGFPSVMLARKVHYTLSPDPWIRLHRRDAHEVTQDVNEGLLRLGVTPVGGKIVLDTRARLHIQKHDPRYPSMHPMTDGMYHLDSEEFADFLMHPFERNIGIIMPHEVDIENEHEIVMIANVIENSGSVDAFRTQLNAQF